MEYLKLQCIAHDIHRSICIFARFLLANGADKLVLTIEGERPIDLCEPNDLATISVMLDSAGPSNTEQLETDEFTDVNDHVTG